MSTTTYNVVINVQGKDSASGPLASAGGSLKRIGEIAGGILGAGMLTSIASGLMNTGKEALGAIASYEGLTMSIGRLMAREMTQADSSLSMADALKLSADKAKDMLAWTQKLSIQSPFTSESISASVQMMMGMGRTSEQAKVLAQNVLDLTAGMGKGEESIGRVSFALAKVSATGKLTGESMMMLNEAGVPVNSILKTMGKTIDDVSKGTVDADGFFQAFTDTVGKDFKGAAKDGMNTVSGLVSTFEEIKQIGLRSVFTGMVEAVKPLASALSDWLTGPGMAKLESLGTTLGAGLTSLVGSFTNLGDTVAPIMAKLKPGLDGFASFWTTQGPTIKAIAGVMLAKFAEVAQWFAAEILPFLVSQFNKLGMWFKVNGPLISRFAGVIAAVFGGILIAAQTMWVFLKPIFDGLITNFLNFVTFIMQLFTGDFKGAIDTLVRMFWTGLGFIQAAFTNLAAWVTGWFGTSWATVAQQWGAFFTGLWAAVVQWWNNVVAGFVGFFKGIGSAIAKWRADTMRVWSDNFKQLQTIFATISRMIVTAILTWLLGIVNDIVAFATSLMTAWMNAWNALIGAIVSIAVNIITAVSQLITDVVAAITARVAEFLAIGAAIVAAIQTGITNAWASFVDWITGLVGDIIKNILAGLGVGGESVVNALNNMSPTLSPSYAVTGGGFGGGGPIQPRSGTTSSRSNAYYFGGVKVYNVVKPQTGRSLLKEFDR
jgi:tape measure domain-containing protein